MAARVIACGAYSSVLLLVRCAESESCHTSFPVRCQRTPLAPLPAFVCAPLRTRRFLLPMKQLTVTIPEKSVMIGSRIGLASTSPTRFLGLMGKKSLEPGSGILIRPSSGVHTMFMRFAIDVVGLDRDMRVVKVWPRLRPWRLTSVSLKVQSVLELAPGQAEHCGIEPGDQLVVLENA